MAKNQAQVITAARLELRDVGAARWSADQITEHVQHAVREISKYRPQEKSADLYARHDSMEVDISSLTDMLFIREIEYQVDLNPKSFKNGSVWGDYLRLNLSTNPQAYSIGYLTGTVTFTAGSTAVAGAGTDFENELVVGYYIKKSGGSTWYRVTEIGDATTLTISAAAETEDDGADTEDGTPYWYEIVRVYYGAMHTIAADSTTLPDLCDQLVIDGTVAYACLAWAEEVRNTIEAAISVLTNAETAIGAIDTKMDLGFGTGNYLETGDDFIAEKETELDAALAKVEAEIDQAVTDLDSGRDLINTVNVGDSVAANYASYASRGVANAAGYIQEMRAYLQRDSIANEYLNYARACLEAAQTEAAQARAYMQDCAQRLSASGVIARTQAMGEKRLALFLQGCRQVRRRRQTKSHPDIVSVA